MKYKEWMKLIHKYPCKDLNGKVVAYDTDGTALGEVIFKEGKVISRKKYMIEGKRDSLRLTRRGKDDEATRGFIDC